MRALRTLYGLTLLAFPALFRKRFRIVMLETFDQACADARRAGGMAELLRFALPAIADALIHGLAGRFKGPMNLGRAPRPGRSHFRLALPDHPLDAAMHDLTWAVRSLLRRPALSLAVIVTVTLGIGTTTAMFSLMDGVLFRPLPYPEPERLVSVFQTDPRGAGTPTPISPANYLDLRDSSEAFSGLAATLFRPFSTTVRIGDEPAMRATTYTVTVDLFDVLQVQPQIGRSFTREESLPQGPRVAILSHELWRTAFGTAPDALGRELTIAGNSHEIVGVMPPDFYFQTPVDIWLPMNFDAAVHFAMAADIRHIGMMNLVGRLADARTHEQAADEMNTLFAGLRTAFPEDNEGLTPIVRATKQHQVGPVSRALWLLGAAVATMLVITGLNVAVLLIASGATRRAEIATRLALGSSSGRLVRQGLLESVLLALTGAVGGGLLASGLVRGLLAAVPGALPRQSEIAVDARVWLFGLLMALLTGIAFGLLPALLQSRSDLVDALRTRAATAGAGTGRLRQGLIVAEVALAFVLLIGAGLLVRSFGVVLGVDPGFDTSQVLTTGTAAPGARAETVEGRIAYFEALREELLALPGVTAVGYSSRTPFGGGSVDTTFQIEGYPVQEGREPRAQFRRAGPSFFETLRIPVLAGRTFGPMDRPETERVVIINDAVRREYFESDPIGQYILWGNGQVPYRVVGVVGDVRYFGLDSPAPPEMYISSNQAPNATAQVFVRTVGDPTPLMRTLRDTLAAANLAVSVPPVRTMDEMVRASLTPRRLPAFLVSGFGLFALLLAAVGLYGVLAYLVQERSREIGLRIALGAPPASVLGSVVGNGLRVTGIGLALGVGVALATTRYLNAVLFGVGPNDPVTFLGVASLLLAVAAASSMLPAMWATRVDPMRTLKGD